MLNVTNFCLRKCDISKFKKPDIIKDTKICSKCQRKLPREAFYPRSKGDVMQGGVRPECKECWIFINKRLVKKRRQQNRKGLEE